MSDDDLGSLLRAVGRAPPRPLAGPMLRDERYELRTLLGEGSFGSVYEAFDRVRDEVVALKVLRRAGGEALLRFKREFRVLARLADPAFVRLHELHGDGDRWYFTMDLVRGVPFDAWVADPDRLRTGFAALFDALERLHARGIVHRDLKPSNVLVAEGGRVVLLDFGLAQALEDAASTSIAGTPAYVAPEVAAGAAPSPASDWYAVGVMLFEALTGELPFEGSALEIVRQKQDRDAPPVLERAPGAPRDLAQLCDALLARRAEERSSRLHERREAPRAPFVGRDGELQVLLGALDEASGAAPALVRVTGPSGVGKTTLVRRFAALARDRGAHVLVGRCHPNDRVPFLALDGLVDELARMLARMPPSRVRALAPRDAAELAAAFPVLRSSPAFTGPEVNDGSRSRVGAALRELLGRFAAPWVLVVDDAHWGDPDSAAVLRDLLREGRCLLVTVHRSDAPAGFLQDVTVREIALERLTDDDARELARGLGAGDDVDAIARDARGHPLFVVEMARELASGAGPRSLAQIVQARIAALPGPARFGAELLAVAAGPVDRAVLRRAGVADAAVDALCDAALATPHDGRAVRVAHDRLREEIVALLDADRTRVLHRALAGAIAEVQPERAEALALHFEAAGDDAEARRQLLVAARRATATRAHARAHELYARLLSRSPGAGGADGELALRIEHAEASARAGLSVEAADAFLAASRLATEEDALRLRVRAAEQLLTSGHLARGEHILDEQLAKLGAPIPSSTPGRALQAARDVLGRRLDPLIRPKASASEIKLTALRAACRAALSTNPARAVTLGASLTREAAKPGASDHARLTAAMLEAFGMVSPRGPDAVPRALSLLARTAPDRDDPRLAELYALAEGLVRYFGLDIGASVGAFERVGRINRELKAGRTFEETMAKCLRSACAWILGDVDHLRASAQDLCAELDERDHVFGWVLVSMHRVWLTLVERGAGTDFDAQLDAVRERWGSRGLELQAWWFDIGRIHGALARGDGRTAWHLARPQARPYRERFFATQMHRVEAQAFLGRAAIHIGLRDPRSPEVRAARKIVDEMLAVPAPWSRALALCLRAGLTSLTGDPEATAGALRAALPATDDAGMVLLGTLVRLALGRTLRGEEGRALVRTGEQALRAWRIDPDVAAATTLPGAW